jgi:hypothetical protein
MIRLIEFLSLNLAAMVGEAFDGHSRQLSQVVLPMIKSGKSESGPFSVAANRDIARAGAGRRISPSSYDFTR